MYYTYKNLDVDDFLIIIIPNRLTNEMFINFISEKRGEKY